LLIKTLKENFSIDFYNTMATIIRKTTMAITLRKREEI
jgi:hypothetical protein